MPVPHLFVNRPRQLALVNRHPSARDNLRWETANTAVYPIGGVMFIWGSVLFFPALESRSDRGAWVFFVASLMYVAVTGHDFLEVLRYRAALKTTPVKWDRFEAWAAVSLRDRGHPLRGRIDPVPVRPAEFRRPANRRCLPGESVHRRQCAVPARWLVQLPPCPLGRQQ